LEIINDLLIYLWIFKDVSFFDDKSRVFLNLNVFRLIMLQQSATVLFLKRGLGASSPPRSTLTVFYLSSPPSGPGFSGAAYLVGDYEFENALAIVASCSLEAPGGADDYFETTSSGSSWIFTYFGSTVAACVMLSSTAGSVGLASLYMSVLLLKAEFFLQTSRPPPGAMSRIFFQIASLFLVTKYFSGPPYYLICSTSIIF